MFSSWKCIFVQFLENGKEPAVRGPRVGGLPRACGELNACRSEPLTPWDPRNHDMATRFDVALALASQASAGLIRKGAENSVEVALRLTLTHPVTVVTLVQRFGGTEDQVVAALLHDVLEEEGGAGVV